MPVYRGRDSEGNFYQWGKDVPGRKHWAKYYYQANNERSRLNAKRRAVKQGMAAMASRNNPRF